MAEMEIVNTPLPECATECYSACPQTKQSESKFTHMSSSGASAEKLSKVFANVGHEAH